MIGNRGGRFRGGSRFFGIVALLLLFGCGCASTVDSTPETLTGDQIRLNVESFELAWETIRDNYWDPTFGGVDWDGVHDELLPQVRAATTQSEFRQAMSGLLEPFEVSHFSITPADVYEDLQGNSATTAEGTVGLDVRVIDGEAIVTRVEAGSPAAQADITPGWRIVRVNGDKIAPVLERVQEAFGGKTMLPLVEERAVEHLLSAPVGEEVSVRFRDAENRRENVKLSTVAVPGEGVPLGDLPPIPVVFQSELLPGDIGYIRFTAFMNPPYLMPEFEAAIREFWDTKGIILDIRGNPGGLPVAAMGMAGWLTDATDEHLGTMSLRGAELQFAVNPRLESYSGLVAVLIDGSSGSTSEIFAAGLEEMGRARLFGTRTAGAVLPARWRRLPNGDFLYYPVANYVTKNGVRLEGVGIEPPEPTPHTREALLAGRDTALEAAVTWITNEAAPDSAPKG